MSSSLVATAVWSGVCSDGLSSSDGWRPSESRVCDTFVAVSCHGGVSSLLVAAAVWADVCSDGLSSSDGWRPSERRVCGVFVADSCHGGVSSLFVAVVAVWAGAVSGEAV